MNENGIKYTIDQVAEFLGISKSTVRYWEKVFDIEPDRTDGNHRRYSWGQVQRFQKIKELYDQHFSTEGVRLKLQEAPSEEAS